jgi:hypothetical protein
VNSYSKKYIHAHQQELDAETITTIKENSRKIKRRRRAVGVGWVSQRE